MTEVDGRVVLGPDDFDRFGRGPLQREYETRMGFDPRSAVGFKTFVAQLRAAENGGHEFPDMFRAMLGMVVEEIIGPRIEEERAHTLAMCETMVLGLVDDRLEPVRKAFANLRSELKRKPALASR
jgi:hypothetical protein